MNAMKVAVWWRALICTECASGGCPLHFEVPFLRKYQGTFDQRVPWYFLTILAGFGVQIATVLKDLI